MTGKDILDQAAGILRRQDLDRSQLLFFVNTVRRAILRDRTIKRFFRYMLNIPMASGVIDMAAQKIKSPISVEWQYDDNGTAKRTQLSQVFGYKSAIDIYGSLTVTGSPTGFLIVGTELYILPAPATGQINIYGEFWPEDLTDSSASSDITTIEIPEAWIYLACAEYFDFLGEEDKGGYWRQKGQVIVDKYIAELNGKEMNTADPWGSRRPFGRPVLGRQPANTTDLETGTW